MNVDILAPSNLLIPAYGWMELWAWLAPCAMFLSIWL